MELQRWDICAITTYNGVTMGTEKIANCHGAWVKTDEAEAAIAKLKARIDELERPRTQHCPHCEDMANKVAELEAQVPAPGEGGE